MALTVEQEIALFQILEVPWQPVVLKPAGPDNLFFEKSDATNSIRQARQAILDYLAAYINGNAVALAKLQAYCDRWIEIGTDTVVMDQGSTGALTGVTSDPERERLEIQRQVKGFVPFYRAHVEVERAATSGPYVGIVR
jgi:hypothetical protein